MTDDLDASTQTVIAYFKLSDDAWGNPEDFGDMRELPPARGLRTTRWVSLPGGRRSCSIYEHKRSERWPKEGSVRPRRLNNINWRIPLHAPGPRVRCSAGTL